MSNGGSAPQVFTEMFPDRSTLEDATSGAILAALHRGLRARGAAHLVVTGGRTVSGVYEHLAGASVAWDQVDVTLSDERWVAPTSDQSNERLIRAHLLQQKATAARFVPLMSVQDTLSAAAQIANERLSSIARPFDCVLLGMGEDGHFASLFPGNPALRAGLDDSSPDLCIAVPATAPAPTQDRLSMTLRATLDARLILIVATGLAKRQVFERARAANEPDETPISALLHQRAVPVRFLWAE